MSARLEALQKASHDLSDAFRRFDEAAPERWDEAAYNDLWEAVKEIARLVRMESSK